MNRMLRLVELYEEGVITLRECVGQLIDHANREELVELVKVREGVIDILKERVDEMPDTREGMDNLLRAGSVCCATVSVPTEEEKAAYEKEWRDKAWRGIQTIRDFLRECP